MNKTPSATTAIMSATATPSENLVDKSTTSQASTPSTTAAPQAKDEHAGKGGLYQMVDGVRTLVERTEPPKPSAPADPA
ncbi:hypothetical protein BH10PSE18_BH10PSE18_19050 [soil metagenome]